MVGENWDVLVRRDDFNVTDVRDATTPTLEPGEVRLSVERFGVMSNNLTYAYLGEAANYWDAFPAPRRGETSEPGRQPSVTRR